MPIRCFFSRPKSCHREGHPTLIGRSHRFRKANQMGNSDYFEYKISRHIPAWKKLVQFLCIVNKIQMDNILYILYTLITVHQAVCCTFRWLKTCFRKSFTARLDVNTWLDLSTTFQTTNPFVDTFLRLKSNESGLPLSLPLFWAFIKAPKGFD